MMIETYIRIVVNRTIELIFFIFGKKMSYSVSDVSLILS
jgi:hypothetical protein